MKTHQLASSWYRFAIIHSSSVFTSAARLSPKQKLLSAVAFIFLLLGVWSVAFRASAATATLVTDAETAVTGWGVGASVDSSCAGGTLCDTVDEGATDNTADYIQTNTTNDLETATFELSTVSNVASASQISVRINARASVVGQSTIDTLTVYLVINGTEQTIATCTPGNASWVACTATASGSWDQTTVDGMKIKIVRNIIGTKGSTASRADTTEVSNVTGTLTYTPGIQFSQTAYRFYENTDSTDVGAPLANQDSSIMVSSNDSFRLRVNVGVSNVSLDKSYRWKQISLGSQHTCAISLDDKAYCWGFNGSGQLGNGNTGTDSTTPVAVSTSGALAGKAILRISVGNSHSCVLASDNQVYCWGSNSYGELGNGNTGTISNVPVTISMSGVLSGKTIKQISARQSNTCVIASDDKAYCWGGNSYGQLGNGTTGTSSNVPVTVSAGGVLSGKSISNIAVGDYHVCVISFDGQVFCWGNNNSGQLGNGITGTNSNVPVAVSMSGVLAGKTVRSVSAGTYYTCAIASDSQAYCWGSNSNGQLGNNNITVDSNTPVAVTTSGVFSGKTILSLMTGGDYGCAIASDSQAYCWGSNMFGQIGNNGNTSTAYAVPVAVDVAGPLAGETLSFIATGHGHSCAISTKNQFFCWGRNNFGQLGAGSSGTDSKVPLRGYGFQSFKLQYKLSAGSTCDTTGTYADVTAASPIRYMENPTPVNGSSLTGNGNDPVTGATRVNQSYVESNDALVTSNIPSGQEGMWDFSLSAGRVFENETYCLKLVDAAGIALTSYSAFPTVNIAPASLSQSNYRFFQTASQTGGLGAGVFEPKTDITLGGVSRDGVAQDFNNDGFLDIATANNTANTMSVLLGNGDGSFQARTDYASGATPDGVAAGDFNADGKKDLVIANWGASSVSIYLNNGNGTFQAKTDYPTGGGPYSVSVSDFNGDGKLDLVTASNSSDTVSVLIGDGDGTFQAKTDFSVGTGVQHVLATDVNGDSIEDIVAANYGSSSVSVLIGNGNGTFQTKTDYATGTSPTSVAAADFDADGKIDLVTSNTGANTVSVLINNGNGTFQAKTDYATGTQPQTVTATDLNADGYIDMAAAHIGGVDAVSVLFGDGVGGFSSFIDYPTASNPYGIMSGDFNGDGRNDLATADNGVASVSILLNMAPQFINRVDYGALNGPQSVIGDTLSADNVPDLAIANSTGNSVSVLIGNGDGTFQNQVDYTVGSTPYDVESTDLNADNILDLVSANNGADSVSVLLGNGDGTFQSRIDYQTGAVPYSLAIDDFNADGNTDIATANFTGSSVSVLLGNGDGTFQPKTDYTSGGGTISVASGDFNADGNADIATANFSSNSLSVLLGNGDGTFQPKTDYTSGSSPYAVTVSDLEGDGIQSLLSANRNGNSVSVLLGNSDGTFQAKTDYTTGAGAMSVTTKDFNADGMVDIVTANYTNNSVSILVGNGDGTFGQKTDYASGNGALSVATEDFNSDGMLDLALANTTADSITVLTNNFLSPPDVGQPLGLAGEGIQVQLSNPFSLRMLTRVDGSGILKSGTNLKLQYADKGAAATCALVSSGSYSDITSGTAVKFFDDTSYKSNSAIFRNINDPTDGTREISYQTYQESNSIANGVSPLYPGQSTMWQYSLTTDPSASAGSTICLRAVTSSGNLFSSYITYPEITIAGGGGGSTLSQQLRGGQSVVDGVKSPFGW
jgi:hypothetical protein